MDFFSPFALRMAKILWSFGRSECKRVNSSPMRKEAKELKKENPMKVYLCFLLTTVDLQWLKH